MADVTPNDVALVAWQTPDPPALRIIQAGDPSLPTNAARLSGSLAINFPTIVALATVTVRGNAGDDVGLWRFGFIQLAFINTEWAHYRNPNPAEGSAFVARDRPPALDQQLCRDSVVKPEDAVKRLPFLEPIIFYDAEAGITQPLNIRVTGVLPLGTRIPAAGKLVFSIHFSDSPSPHFFGLNWHNRTAVQINQLYSLQYSKAFATMFAVQKGPGRPIVVLKSFQWNVRFRGHFGTHGGLNVQLPPRLGDVFDMNISHVVNGTPDDRRFQFSVLDTTLPICNAQIPGMVKNQVVRESKTHEDWKVTH